MNAPWSAQDRLFIARLNDGSWQRSFSPGTDVDWTAVTTTDDELRALYDAWSLLRGSRHDAALTDTQRITFAAFQQVNLMWFTALFERFSLGHFETLYGDDPDRDFQEYVSHLIKEETYHYLLFSRAIDALRRQRPTLPRVRDGHMRLYLRLVLALMAWMPRRVRHGMFFFFLRFAEEITLQANTVARRTVPRADSLVPRVWLLHAIDEARHIAFDDWMMKRAAHAGVLGNIPRWLTLPLCVGASLLLNLNEIAAARALGIRVGYLELPRLLRTTTAPFKRRVVDVLLRGPRPHESEAA